MIVKNYHGRSLFRKLFRRLTLDGIAGLRFLAEGKLSHLFAVLKAHFSFYMCLGSLRKKRHAEKAATLRPNLKGIYTGSIIKHFFIKKKRYFRDLDPTLFR